MKNLITILIMVLFVSCKQGNTVTVEEQTPQSKKVEAVVNYNDTPRGISIQTIDNCQYIYAETSAGVAIVHKANCDNPVHHESH